MSEMPEWLKRLPPLTEEEISDGVESARRHLERSTPDMAVEPQRLIVALGDEIERLREMLDDLEHFALERSERE